MKKLEFRRVYNLEFSEHTHKIHSYFEAPARAERRLDRPQFKELNEMRFLPTLATWRQQSAGRVTVFGTSYHP